MPYNTNLLFIGKISPVGNILFHEGLWGFHSSAIVGKWSWAPIKPKCLSLVSKQKCEGKCLSDCWRGRNPNSSYIRQMEYTVLSEHFETSNTTAVGFRSVFPSLLCFIYIWHELLNNGQIPLNSVNTYAVTILHPGSYINIPAHLRIMCRQGYLLHHVKKTAWDWQYFKCSFLKEWLNEMVTKRNG